MENIFESPLLKNNEQYLGFEYEGKYFFITYNSADGFLPEGYALLNNKSERLNSLDYSVELEEGKKHLKAKFG